ncbi:MAG TPA: GNAT family N-acetyltransferase [Thermoleophilaceae bacterium]|nr:GNAT family N-acetyltransferase [Thermoleophilaceae bacterium]
MTGARDFRALTDVPSPERFVSDLQPWIHEAGNPYLDWLFGAPDSARAALAAWMVSDGSEISLGRVVGLFEGGNPIGGYVGLSGSDLAKCVRKDAITALKVAGRDGRPAFLERARELSDLRRPVEPDEWFLSKLGVLVPYRRGGRGRALLEDFLGRGAQAGFSRFRLDVWARDEHTVRLYESAGFLTFDETFSEEMGMRLLAMRLG